MKGKVQGRVEKNFVSGIDGRVRLEVVDGVLHDFPLLAPSTAGWLAGGRGSDTRFERLSATLAIAQAVAATDDLVIDARNLRVDGAGRIGFDGALNLRGLVTISAARVRRRGQRARARPREEFTRESSCRSSSPAPWDRQRSRSISRPPFSTVPATN